MVTEQTTIASLLPDAARDTAAHFGFQGWQVVRTAWEGPFYCVVMEREGREPEAQVVRAVAEQAAAVGLRRIEGAADVIYSGTFLEASNAGG